MAKATEYTIARAFDHKTLGRIGLVNLTASVEHVTLDGKVLPNSSVEYLLTFALQNLQDAYAGADNLDEAQARWAKKLDRLIAGTIGTREAGAGASAEMKARRSVVREQVRAKVTKEKWASFQELEAQEQADKLDAIFEAQDATAQAAIMAQVKVRLEEAAKRAEQAKALSSSISIDL